MKNIDQKRCAVIESLKLFSAKWKPCILCYLIDGSKRYGELFRLIPNINKKMLSQHLRELEKDGLVKRTAYPVIPPKVVYSVTTKGKSLETVFKSLEAWGLKNVQDVCTTSEMLDVVDTTQP